MNSPSFPRVIPVDLATVPVDQLRHLPRDQRPESVSFHTTLSGARYRVVPVTITIELDGLIPLVPGAVAFPSVIDDTGDVRFLNPEDGEMDWLVLDRDGVEFTVEYR